MKKWKKHNWHYLKIKVCPLESQGIYFYYRPMSGRTATKSLKIWDKLKFYSFLTKLNQNVLFFPEAVISAPKVLLTNFFYWSYLGKIHIQEFIVVDLCVTKHNYRQTGQPNFNIILLIKKFQYNSPNQKINKPKILENNKIFKWCLYFFRY